MNPVLSFPWSSELSPLFETTTKEEEEEEGGAPSTTGLNANVSLSLDCGVCLLLSQTPVCFKVSFSLAGAELRYGSSNCWTLKDDLEIVDDNVSSESDERDNDAEEEKEEEEEEEGDEEEADDDDVDDSDDVESFF